MSFRSLIDCNNMKQLQISFTEREEKGRHPSSRLRNSGRIPAVIYGKSGTSSVSIDDREFRMLMREKGSAAAIVELVNEQRKLLSIINEIQRDSITDRFLHVDFQEVAKDEKFTIVIPVRVKGEAFGVKNEKAMLEVVRHKVGIRCLPEHLIEAVEVDVTDLHANHNIHVKDLPKFEGVEYVGDQNGVVVACVAEEAEEEAPAIPTAAAPAAPAAK